MKKTLAYFLSMLLTVAVFACRKQEVLTVKPDFSQISDGTIERIVGKNIIFFHMSVGDNILDGIRKIQELDSRFKKIKISDFEPGMDIVEPAIYQWHLEYNTLPDKKVEACERLLVNGEAGKQFGSVVFKYCYVDIKLNTDVDDVFTSYKRMVTRLKKQYPNLNVIHVTVPLTVHFSGLKGWVKTIVGKEHPNEKRSYFNEKLVEEYGQSDKIFDLAKMESTDRNGKRLFYNSNNKKVFYMAKEHTDDGGHLNEAGRILAAIEFLKAFGGAD